MSESITDGTPSTEDVARRRLYLGSIAAMVVFAASVATPSICLREIAAEFGLSFADRGLLGSLRMGSLLVALMATGYIADRRGKRGALSVGMLLVGAGFAATALAASYASILGAQALVGVGAGAVEALINPLVAELHPVRPARPLNITNGFFSVGLVVAALIAGEGLEAGHPWRLSLWVWVLPAVVAGMILATRRYPARVASDSPKGEGKAFVARPLFWVLMGAMVLAGGCESGMTFWGTNFTEQEFGVSPRSGALTVAVFGAFMAIGRFASAGLLARIQPAALMIVSAAAGALATAGLCFTQSLHGAWSFFALGGLFVACFWPTLLAFADQNVQTGSTLMFAALAAAGISGCAIFPWAIGAIGDVSNLRVGAGLLPVSMAALAMVLLVARRMATGAPPAPSAGCLSE